MLPSTPIEDEEVTGTDSPSEEVPPLRKFLWQIDPRILRDWEFWDAISRIAVTAAEQPDVNLFWRLAYQQLAFACDHLSALIFRQDQRPEFGP